MVLSFLKSDLEARTRKNPGYSLRAYAKVLKIDSSSLSAILAGRRPLTLKTAKRILTELGSEPAVRQMLLSSLSVEGGDRSSQFTQLSEVDTHELAGWEHLAILSLLETKNCEPTLRGMASQLGISVPTAIAALARLEKSNLAYKERGRWKCTGKQVSTTTDIPSSALRRAHLQYIEKAIYSLEHHSVEERDITGMTMAISRKKIPQAKKLITEFRRNLCQYLESGDKDSVYRVNIQLFPIGR